MTDPVRLETLAAECRVFSSYLVGTDQSLLTLDAYIRGHDAAGVDGATDSACEHALLRLARVSPRCARAADGYAAVFARTSQLRRKLVLMVAILESRHQSAEALERMSGDSRAAWICGTALRVIRWIVSTVFVALILPLIVARGWMTEPRRTRSAQAP